MLPKHSEEGQRQRMAPAFGDGAGAHGLHTDGATRDNATGSE